ncbi:inactive serine/threonine-protein kinase 19 isoform 1-T1 [Lycaon pictus]
MRNTRREKQRHRQSEKQAPCRDPDVGLHLRTPGSHLGPKAGAKPLSHPGIPHRTTPYRKELQEQGEIRIVQLGFDLDAHGIIFTEDYRTRVLRACDGRPYAGAVQKFLALVLPACGDLSFQQDQMTETFGFRDPEITHLVNAGVLTVRDAGSWWLAVPGAGRFIKYFVKGRQAVLSMVRKAKYRELLLSELLGRRAPASVRLGLTYHVHDLIGAQLVDCVSTTSGTLLRLPET